MPSERIPLTAGQLTPLARSAFGRNVRVERAVRLRGGSKKGVYRLFLDGGRTAVAYVWAPGEDYWPATPPDESDPFSHASGIGLFQTAHARLSELGVRTPEVYVADAGASAAVIEDVARPSLEDLMETVPHRVAPVMRQLSESLRALHADRSTVFGKLEPVMKGRAPTAPSCAAVVLPRALTDLADAAARVPRIAEAQSRLAGTLHRHAAAIGPRGEHSLIHGELGPDHVLVGRDGRPAIIDIEGLMYFDREWEHVFLRLRFGGYYHHLEEPAPDPDRLALYRLAMHLNLVAGPLRLLDGDYPDRGPFLQIAEYNTRAAIELAGAGGAGARRTGQRPAGTPRRQ